MQKKIFSNFLYQAASQILVIIVPVITIPVVSRALGPEGVGAWNYVNSIVQYFLLVGGLGLATYGVREIAVVAHDRFQRSKKFWELEFFNFFFSFSAFLVYIIMSFFSIRPALFLIQGFAVFSALLDITWFFSGIEKFRNITIRNFIVKIITFICILIFINEPEDLWKYFLINSLSVFFSQLILWFSIYKYVDFIKVSFKEIWSHFVPSLSFFLAKISSTIFANINKTFLGLLGTYAAVGIYSNSITMVIMLMGITNALNAVMVPRMSSLQKEQKESDMVKMLEQTIHFQFFLTFAMTFGIIATNSKMVGWFFGDEFSQMIKIVPLLAPTMIIQSLHVGIATQYLIPKGDMKSYNYSILFGALISIIIDFITIPVLGVYGGVIGTMVAQVIVCIIRVYILLKQTSFKFDLKKISGYFLVGVLMLLVIHLLTNKLPSSVKTTIIQVIIGVIVYMGGTLILKINPLKEIISKNK